METTTVPCRICGSLKLVHGRIDDALFVVPIPSFRSFRFVTTDRVALTALACLECGNVQMQVDPDKIKSILGENPK